jgi:hypothetical protein
MKYALLTFALLALSGCDQPPVREPSPRMDASIAVEHHEVKSSTERKPSASDQQHDRVGRDSDARSTSLLGR